MKNEVAHLADSFKIDDRVLIYITTTAELTDANKTSFVRFDGLVTDVNYVIDGNGRVFVITGANRLEKLLTYTFPGLYYTQYESNGTTVRKRWTAVQAIQDIINRVNYAMRKGVGGTSLTPIVWDDSNDTTTQYITYVRNYKPSFEMIEDLSNGKNGKKNH